MPRRPDWCDLQVMRVAETLMESHAIGAETSLIPYLLSRHNTRGVMGLAHTY